MGDDPVLAEDYARYGSLLLRLAIQNNDQNVLGGSAASGAGVAGGEEISAALLMAESNKKQKLIQFSGDDSFDEEDSVDDNEEEDTPGNAAFDDEIAAAQEEDDDFTIAWENLDVARLLFEKRLSSATSAQEQSQLTLKLARVYQDLGDLSLEDGNPNPLNELYLLLENFEQAISDYQEALKAFATSEQDHLRDIAGIYFNLALCQEFCSRLPEASEMYSQAKLLLERKRDSISSDDEKATESGEVGELEGLIGEIGAKLEDLAAGKSSIGEAQAEGLEQMRSAALQAAQSLSGSINDLSGMIKKRKPE